MTNTQSEGVSEDVSLSASPNSRPKRRKAKVDYTEKKDYDFEIPTNHNSQVLGPGTSLDGKATTETPEPGSKNGKKKSKKNASSGSNTRADTPLSNGADEDDGGFPLNYQPDIKNSKFSQILDLTDAVVKDEIELILSNGEKLVKNDNIYLICEPPGEPYYIGRIMGFVKKDYKQSHSPKESDNTKIKTRHGKSLIEPAEGYKFKINWYYRARDISKHSNDSRLLYASMHSDTCPLQSFRGKCVVKHKEEVGDFDAFKSVPNNFWFDKLFDRYMIRFYDVLPTLQLTSLPINYHTALMKRFPYIFVEQGKSKDMLQSPKSCAKCHQWCSHNDSIECCECNEMYHMLCLDPPLYKKPARGFAWSCIKCTKKLEGQKLIPNKEYSNEEDGSQIKTENSHIQEHVSKLPLYEELAIKFLKHDSELTQAERRNQEEWVYRYLGMHAKLEDALDLQDRPYPRAASRLGSKHQLTGVQDWYGQTVEYYDNSELAEEYQKTTTVKKKKSDGRKKKSTSEEPEETYEPLEVPEKYKDTDPSDFPPWLQERPKGYIERGGEATSTLMWKQPEDQSKADKLDDYIKEAEPIAVKLGLLPNTPNFMDQILKNLLDSAYDFEKAQALNQSITRAALKEPTFTDDEVKKFEEGVRQFGSELYPVTQHVKTQPSAMIVRFYYLWKKTKNGHLIWDNFEGRRKTRNAPKDNDETEDLGNSADDSSYDRKKTAKRTFQCKHCKTMDSIQWFRSPGPQFSPESSDDKVMALCLRCARLWRRYAVIWEDPNEVMRKTGQKGGNGWKRKVESELMLDSELILKAKAEYVTLNGESVTKKRKQLSLEPTPMDEPIKKVKSSTSIKSSTPESAVKKEKRPYNKKPFEPKQEDKPEIIISNVLADTPNTNLQQAKVERYYQSTSPVYNSRVKFQEMPNQRSPLVSQSSSKLIKPVTNSKKCAVCLENSDPNSGLFCYGCGIMIHPQCYGVDMDEVKNPFGSYKWYCDPCSNDLNPLVSSNYKCALCGMHNDDEIVKSGLKRTNDGKWVHVLCALFNKDTKFSNIQTIQPITGIYNAIATKVVEGIMFTKCHVCEKPAKLSEALKPGSNYHVGFKLDVEAKPDSKCVKVSNNFGKLHPVAVCGAHSLESLSFELLPLTAQVKRFKQSTLATAFQLYIDEFKKPLPNGFTGVQARFAEFHDACKILDRKNTNGGGVDDETKKAVISCSKCNAVKTLKWIDSEGEKICYNCHLQQQDVEMQDADQDDGADVEEVERGYEKIVEVSNGALYGGNYGIEDPNDKLIKPEFKDEEYTFDPQPTPTPQGPQQLPFKNGTVSEYKYYPPPPAPPSSDSQNGTPKLGSFINGEVTPKLPTPSLPVELPASVISNPVVNDQPQQQAPVIKQEEKKSSINSIMNTDQNIKLGNDEYKKMSIGSILG